MDYRDINNAAYIFVTDNFGKSEDRDINIAQYCGILTVVTADRFVSMQKIEIANPEVTVIAIQQEICRSAESRYQHRLHALLLVCKGQSCQQVADLFGEDRRTVQRWIKRFEAEDLDGLQDDDRAGRPKSLDGEQWEKLKQEVLESPRNSGYKRRRGWGPKLLMEHLKVKYGASLGLRQCQRIIREIDPALAARRRKRSAP